MTDFYATPYKGDPAIPHVSEDFFKVVFAGANIALAALSLPGRFMGSEVRPRKYNRDYVIACCEEAAQKREMAAGKLPTQTYRKPQTGPKAAQSHERKWWAHLQDKRWTQERMGPNYPST